MKEAGEQWFETKSWGQIIWVNSKSSKGEKNLRIKVKKMKESDD